MLNKYSGSRYYFGISEFNCVQFFDPAKKNCGTPDDFCDAQTFLRKPVAAD
jgi:hypothetical protein